MNNLERSIELVSKKFVYKEDKNTFYDYWYVMKDRNGVFYGDCEDFALTIFWFLSNQSLIKFLWNLLITHQYKLHRVMSKNGYHVVGEYRGQWFDNWTFEALHENEFFYHTGHKHLYMYISPVFVIYLFLGLLKR